MTDQVSAEKAIVPLCRHIKTNGYRCKSPALRGQTFCYFHRSLHDTHRRPERVEALTSYWQEWTLKSEEPDDQTAIERVYPTQNQIAFPPLEDAESVQLATSILFQAVATGRMHFHRARILLAALKIACINQHALFISRASHNPEELAQSADCIAVEVPSASPQDEALSS